ncbi:hypothetical protein DFH29DRAFT_1024097, partial [Suillus ampliporus]
MSGQKKTCLKALSYSFKDRGSLSQQKDLDVDYFPYKPTTGKRGKPSWLKSPADPLYKMSVGCSSSSSPRKRVKEVLMEFPEAETYDTYQETFGDFVLEAEAAQHTKKTKTQNDFIAEYLVYQDLYLDIILDSEQFVRTGICETCQSAEATFSCVTCTGDHGWCRPCMIKSHQSLPFYKIQLWINKCFQDVTLADQGFIWVFMHNVAWCHCQGSNPQQHLQLLRAGLFPASSTQPKTAFTFEVLDHFLIDALECKTSARSFFEKLTRLTNNVFPDTVPDRYRELIRVSRLWRDLKNCKWFGFGHDKESHPDPGDLALFCPSCPQPGINMPLFWEQKYERQYIACRQCYKTLAGTPTTAASSHPGRYTVPGDKAGQTQGYLHMNMREPRLDIFLSDGSGYMVMEAEYEAHLASAMESKERSTCSNHRAVNAANANRSNLRATGVGATAYYSICKAIKHAAKRIDNSLIIYDVGLGKFHLSTHKLACFARYSLNFIEGAAQVDGEILETLWAPFNKISPTARSMSQAHRQAILDDHMCNSNWKKLVGIIKTLLQKYKRANKGIDDTKVPFQELTRSLDINKVSSWESDEKQAMEQRVSWLINGINLEDAHSRDTLRVDIWQLPRDASAAQRAVVEEKRQKLAARISKYHETTNTMTQGLEVNSDMEELGQEAVDLEVALEEISEEVAAEVMGIWMPSLMPHQDALALGLGALQAEELQLRQGQANDCLEKLQQALVHKAIIYHQHFQSADSTWVGTRSKQEAFRCRIKIDKCGRSYQRARDAMQKLGVDEETLTSVYQEIQPSQVNWLKAKARWQRWEEELSLVRHEMGWTTSLTKYNGQDKTCLPIPIGWRVVWSDQSIGQDCAHARTHAPAVIYMGCTDGSASYIPTVLIGRLGSLVDQRIGQDSTHGLYRLTSQCTPTMLIGRPGQHTRMVQAHQPVHTYRTHWPARTAHTDGTGSPASAHLPYSLASQDSTHRRYRLTGQYTPTILIGRPADFNQDPPTTGTPGMTNQC